MGLEKLVRGILMGVTSLLIGSYGNRLYHSSDFSNVRSEKHQRTPITRQVEGKKGERYAIVLNGNGDDEQFHKDTEFIYNSLLRAGFRDENIFVLQSGEKQPSYVDGSATKESLSSTYSQLREKITGDDVFLIVTNNHGSREYFFWGDIVLLIDDGNLTSSELMKLQNDLEANYSIGIFKQCQGEGFASSFGSGNRIGVSAAGAGKNSFVDDYDYQKGFTFHYFSALGGKTPDGKKVNSDLNNDGRVSLEEVFDYAAKTNPNTEPRWYGIGKETPQMYWQNVNPRDLYIR